MAAIDEGDTEGDRKKGCFNLVVASTKRLTTKVL